MNKNFLLKPLLALSLLLSVGLYAQEMPPVEPLPIDPEVRYGKLENGLTYYIRHNEEPKNRCEFHIAQAVGAILEEDDQNGLAHSWNTWHSMVRPILKEKASSTISSPWV